MTLAQEAWVIELKIDKSVSEEFAGVFDDISDSVSIFEEEGSNNWKIQVYTDYAPPAEDIANIIKESARRLGINLPQYTIEKLPATDWVSESQKSFKATDAGGFFIYPSWHESSLPDDKICIQIDPQRAFGTGSHETTKGCLLAIDKLFNEKLSFRKILDMGCGSGILAIAARKIYPNAKVWAADIDPISVQTSEENAHINTAENIGFYVSNGYKSKEVRDNHPYDLIISNILAEPLIDMAPDLTNNLADGGYVILSGLLTNQAESVISAHQEQGLTLLENNTLGTWSILIFKL